MSASVDGQTLMPRSTTRWTAADIPDQTGRTAVITGANAGLGYQAAAALASKGAHVVLAVRNLERGQAAAESLLAAHPAASISQQHLDLASLASIRAAAAQLRADHDRIDLLINNAGVVLIPRAVTSDGFELQFGTNHLGHFALTGLLLDRLLQVEGSRVVTVSSLSHRLRADIHFHDLQGERRYGRYRAYAQAKLANLLFTYELQRRLTGTTTIAVAAHPGFARTDIARDRGRLARAGGPLATLLLHGADKGALPSLRAATDPRVTGAQYFGPDGFAQMRGYPKVVTSGGKSGDLELQRKLWTVSEALTNVVYPHIASSSAIPDDV